MKRKTSAFTLIEMLVVISIIVVLAAFAGPALFSALSKGQLTAEVNNTRQLYLAGQQMALDGSANANAQLVWPGDDATITTLAQYCTRLVTNDYLKTGDLQKLFSAPGVTCTATGATAGTPPVTTVTLGGTSAVKIYPVKENDSSNTVFAVTANYDYDTALDATKSPFGDKGFVVQRKGGDASVFRKNQAVAESGKEAEFQATVGKKPGQADGTVTAGDPTGVLKFP